MSSENRVGSSYSNSQIPAIEVEKRVKTLTNQSKIAIIAFVIGSVVGIIMIGLGAFNAFGPIATTGFIGSIIGASILTLISGGGLIWIAITSCKKQISQMNEYDVIQDLKENFTKTKDISRSLQRIPSEFFKDKSQQHAKDVFSRAMKELLDANVDFPRAGPIENPESLSGKLDADIFQLSITNGVQNDIPCSSLDQEHIHVYQVASQYNAAEATAAFTPGVGKAMSLSMRDATQGPLAQRTNPIAFELVTAFLTHLGFNMLDTALPSAGKTYQEGAPIEHGYLCPDDANIESLTEEFKTHFSEAEFVCYSSYSTSWSGSQPVYLFLQAAPAIGYATKLTKSSDELQKYVALANYLALFRKGITLAKETNKPVVLHATEVGGGVFKNNSFNLQWGFEKAALTLQAEMKSCQVFVQVEAFQKASHMQKFVDTLNIPTKSRIGDSKI